MADIDLRLRELEDIEEIRKLKAAYCAACDDDHNGDAVAALFAPDGVWQRSEQEPNVGREAIAGYMFAIRNLGVLNRSAHMVTNPVIKVNGDSATGHWRFVMMYTAADDETFVRIIGYYDDEYVRLDGQWRFKSLLATVQESGEYQAKQQRDIATNQRATDQR